MTEALSRVRVEETPPGTSKPVPAAYVGGADGGGAAATAAGTGAGPAGTDPAPVPPADTPADAPPVGAAAEAAPDVRRRRRRLGPGRSVPFGRLLGPVLLITVWWAASALGVLDPRILSSPGSVVATASELVADGRLQGNVLVSLQRAGLGLLFGVTAGVVLAVLAGLSRTGEYLVDGPLQIKRAIPSLAMLPLLILWLGIGEEMKVTVIALGVAVNMYIQAYASLTGIDSRYVELAEVLELSRGQFIRKVVAPGSLPGFFVGLRLGVTSSWLGLIVVEQVNATSGIGYMMFQAQQYAQSDVIIVGLVAYGIFGFASDAGVRAIERKVLSWRRTLSS